MPEIPEPSLADIAIAVLVSMGALATYWLRGEWLKAGREINDGRGPSAEMVLREAMAELHTAIVQQTQSNEKTKEAIEKLGHEMKRFGDGLTSNNQKFDTVNAYAGQLVQKMDVVANETRKAGEASASAMTQLLINMARNRDH